MTKRTANFNPGPACLPEEVLQETAAELLDFAGTGMSVLECSHRSPEYDKVHRGTQALIKELLGLGDDYHVLFFGGGASSQFAIVPMNLLGAGQTADYILTGAWSKKALKEAKLYGQTNVAATTEVDGRFARIPTQDELKLTQGAAYVHLTSNNTIFGTQWKRFPEVSAPLVADMSSDFLSRAFDAKKFALIYVGAQKNIGPAGVTVVIVRDDMLARCPANIPAMFHYPTQAKEASLYNTPPCFAIYIVGKVCAWTKAQGGVAAVERENERKAKLLYDTIDARPDFFRAPVAKDSRSLMNVVFRLPTEDHEKRFIAEAKAREMVGIKGHRSVGGIRVSIYNAAPYAWVERMTQLMNDFAAKG
jgi:phosphoserine aminotransferase